MFHDQCCYACKHFGKMLRNLKVSCDAFPSGIPERHFCQYTFVPEILKGRFTPPDECANGVKFEFKEGYEDPFIKAERLRKEGYDVPE